MTTLLFMPAWLVMSCYNELSLRRFADEHTCIWTTVLTIYVVMAGMMLDTNVMDRANLSLCTYNTRFDHISER